MKEKENSFSGRVKQRYKSRNIQNTGRILLVDKKLVLKVRLLLTKKIKF